MKNEFLRLFPVPQLLLPAACGIALEDDSVTLSQALLPSREHDAVRVRLAPGVIERGELKNPDALHEALVQLRSKSVRTAAVVSLPTDAGFLVRMELDAGVEDLKEGVLLGVEEYVPADPADLLVSLERVGRTPEGGTRVVVTAYPRATVVAYEQALVRAGFEPVVAESSMHSLARALTSHDERTSSLVINIGRSRTHAIVVVAARPWLISTIGMGWQRLVDAVGRAGQITPEEAERSVFMHGFAELSNRELFDLMVPAAAALRDEIGKVLRFWDAHKDRAASKASKIREVIISGRGAAIPGVERHMEPGLGVRIRVRSPWDELARGADTVPWVVRNESLAYAAAAGAMRRAFERQW